MKGLERRGDELVFRADALDEVGRRLDGLLGGSSAVDAIGGLLRLGSALRRRLGSPAAADALQALLRARPEARRIARQAFGSGREGAVRRRFQSSLGERPALKAPRLGDAPAGGSTPVFRFLDPTERDRRRVRAQHHPRR